MLDALFLTLATVGISAQSVLKKAYNVKTGNKGAYVFSAISVFFAGLFFLGTSKFDLHFTWEIVPYALGFAASYGMAVLMGFIAIKIGSLSLTSLVTSYSLILPTFYGLIFLDEDVSLLFYIGLILLCASLFLMNSKRGESKITLAWAIVAFLAFFSNGVCSTVQMVQQKDFAGQYKSEVMIIALFTVSVVMMALAFINERNEIKPAARLGGIRAALCGLINGACNLLVMTLAVTMNASIMYPVISAGGILLTGLVSLFIYKEKLSLNQYLALVLGTVSVVLMNI